MSGALSFHAGLAAEHRVTALYQDRGCYLLSERWRCAYGEIDLIFQDPKTGGLILAEVKKKPEHCRSCCAANARPDPTYLPCRTAVCGRLAVGSTDRDAV